MRRLILFAAVLTVVALAETPASIPESPRPRCTSRLRGSFWPSEANSDSKLAVKLAREGDLEICTVERWRYRWSPVSINAKRLAKPRREPPAPRSASALPPE